MKKTVLALWLLCLLLGVTGCGGEPQAISNALESQTAEAFEALSAGLEAACSESSLDAVQAFGAGEVEAGRLDSAVREKNSVIMTLQGDVDVVYAPTGDRDGFLLSYAEGDAPVETRSAVTLTALKSLTPDTLICIRGRGLITGRHGSLLGTGEIPTADRIERYADDLANRRVVILAPEPGTQTPPVFAVTAAFFDHYYGDNGLDGCALFLDVPYSAGDDGLVSALLRAGAKAVAAPKTADFRPPEPLEMLVQQPLGQALTDLGASGLILFGQKTWLLGADNPDMRLPFGSHISRVEDLIATDFQGTERSGAFSYAIHDGMAVLTDYTGGDREAVIPEAIDGYEVTAIGQGCFRGNASLERVVLPDTCLYVHPYAFADCQNLREAVVGNYVQAISRLAFQGSPAVHYVVAPGFGGEAYCKNQGFSLSEDRIAGTYGYASREISYSFGPVAGEGSAIYYWKNQPTSLEDSDTGVQTLICRLSDGRELPLLEAPSLGNLALTESRIFYTVPGENNRLYSCSYWGGEQTYYAVYGEIVYSDPALDMILLQGDGVTLFLPEQNQVGHLMDGEFLGCLDHVAYVGRREEKAIRIMAVDLLRNESWQVLEIYTEDPTTFLTKVCVAEDRLYCGFGSVAEEGYAFGEVLEAGLEGGPVQPKAELTGGGFLVKDGEVLTDGPTTQATYQGVWDRHFQVEEGTVYRTELDNALPEPLFLPGDTMLLQLGQLGQELQVVWAVKNGPDAYALLEEARSAEDSPVRLLMLHKNLDSGFVEILYDAQS